MQEVLWFHHSHLKKKVPKYYLQMFVISDSFSIDLVFYGFLVSNCTIVCNTVFESHTALLIFSPVI